MTDTPPELSIVLPARNEAPALEKLLPVLRGQFPQAQIIVVNDGSTDDTSALCARHGVQEVRHRYSIGNGGAVKSGARAARGELIVFMDADGQHDPADIPRLLARLGEGYDMVVGARDGSSQASVGRSLANRLYNRVANYMTGQQIADLTSGFRAVRADKFREFLFLLPNGFSYPTSITMAFFRAGYGVAYEPIVAARRTGRSHIRPLHDGARFLLIIFRVATLYSPLKIFAPVSGLSFLAGLVNYLYTYASNGRFTNASAVLFTTAVVVFLMGLVSEQITTLLYATAARERRDDQGA
ncbi:glycosyltransferase family 2 protein [Immundisolibacter cernigliae]|uniref:Glycosyl transferase n=1 Tax=Immundisolibacter cernigliae TaxID=1810504 RepID=A0A1B1YVM7_9GAMM|nr:glycosyltransferase family 2 protein [Immundisolibacter cernigliae]ANX04822.1 glycosyl transferase [Immundisolibacter cernigliae]